MSETRFLTFLLTRVIDVTPTDNAEIPRIIETGRRPGTFVALSHCWGSQTHFLLTSATVRERLSGMAMPDLPPAFEMLLRSQER